MCLVVVNQNGIKTCMIKVYLCKWPKNQDGSILNYEYVINKFNVKCNIKVKYWTKTLFDMAVQMHHWTIIYYLQKVFNG